MRQSNPLQFCTSCHRHLPRAARRCPWCKRLSIAYPYDLAIEARQIEQVRQPGRTL